MFEGHDLTVYDLVASHRLVEPDALGVALAEQKATGKSLANLLVDQNLVTRPGLLRAVAEQTGCEWTDSIPAAVPKEILALIEGSLARAYAVCPVSADSRSISLLAADPFNPHIVNDLTFALGREVRLILTDPEQVHLLIRQHYGDKNSPAEAGPAANGPRTEETGDEASLTVADIEHLAGQTPIIRFVNRVLAQAIRDRASDIHFEPFEREFKVRYRIDGNLFEMTPPPRNLALPITSRLKVMANLNIAERRLPQDGRLRLNLGGRAVDLRLSTLPTQFGESVVLRVLDQSAIQLDLGQLGLPASVRSRVEANIRRPNGIFIVTGPTGSGKTTTLYSCLKALNAVDAKLLTVEDPVEYEIEGVMQVPLNLGAGLTFVRALRAFLRQDPDIVMVGEIRDLETAQIAIQASLTGHLVLSTLHTNDAPGAVTRLTDMGIEPYLLASTLEAVLAQRLVRRLCMSCKSRCEPPESLVRQLGADPRMIKGQPIYSGTGCPACHHTGYSGRLGIFEYLQMTDSLRELVLRGASLAQLRQQALNDGMTLLREAGLHAVLAGETTIEEILKTT